MNEVRFYDRAGRLHVFTRTRPGQPHAHPAQRPRYRQPTQQQLRRKHQADRIDLARRLGLDKLQRIAKKEATHG